MFRKINSTNDYIFNKQNVKVIFEFFYHKIVVFSLASRIKK